VAAVVAYPGKIKEVVRYLVVELVLDVLLYFIGKALVEYLYLGAPFAVEKVGMALFRAEVVVSIRGK